MHLEQFYAHVLPVLKIELLTTSCSYLQFYLLTFANATLALLLFCSILFLVHCAILH